MAHPPEAAAPRPAPRLNPFAFPSDTDSRFVLLVISALGTSLLIYTLIYNSIPGNWAPRERCVEEARALHPADRIAATIYVKDCTEPFARRQTLWMVVGVLMLLGVAVALYWSYPRRKIRRGGLVPLTAEEVDEDVLEYLGSLCAEAGLRRRPAFLWNVNDNASSGVAFGHYGQYYVALTKGLVYKFYTDLPEFRATVLHELAHLRNRDVDKTYFAVAVWQAFVIVTLIPFAVSSVGAQLSNVYRPAWRVLALTALVYLTRNAVLRTREFYADARVDECDGPASALPRVLGTHPPLKTGRFWRDIWRLHPDPAERCRTLEDNRRLFDAGFKDSLAAGIAVAIAFPNVRYMMEALLPRLAWLTDLAVGFIFALLTVGVVGVGVWRETFALQARGARAMGGAGRLGLGLGLGLFIGHHLSLTAYAYARTEWGLEGLSLIAFNVFWCAFLAVSMVLFIYWMVACASVWLEVAAAQRSPRPVYLSGLVVASGLLAIWFTVLPSIYSLKGAGVFVRQMTEQNLAAAGFAPDSTTTQLSLVWIFITYFIFQSPYVFIALTFLWLFPLAAWFWRKRAAAHPGPHWAFLHSPSEQLSLPARDPLRPVASLVIGALGGAFCLIPLAGVHLLLLLADDAGLLELWRVMVAPALAMFAPAVVAVVTVLLVGRDGAMHGLFTAFVAGCVLACGLLVVNLDYFTFPQASMAPRGYTIHVLSMVVNGGLVTALPLVLGVSLLANALRRLRPRRA